MILWMYMNAVVEIKSHPSNLLAEDAVINYENKNYVFIARPNKQSQMKEINIGTTENGFTQIKSEDIDINRIVVKVELIPFLPLNAKAVYFFK